MSSTLARPDVEKNSPAKLENMQLQRWCLTLALLCLWQQATTGSVLNPVVRVKSGRVRGLKLRSAEDKEFYAFRGIAYGKSTAGPGRFKPPQPVDPWNDVFDATGYGPECPQFNVITRGMEGTEDCLALNVYSPQLPASSSKPQELLPVMVFIHGGAFVIGTGSCTFYGPERLVDHSIVLVTLNYRLGVLGFLSTGDEASPGNYGMLDQILAFRWVKDNIANFGGDPQQVTIFGESAGSASVIYHILSPLSKGLFERAMALSGSPLNHWALQKQPLQLAQDVAKTVNCPVYDTWKLMDCLKEKSVYELVRKPFDMQISSLFPIFFAPVVEPSHKHGFLTEDPYVLLTSGKIINKVPLVLGITELEFFSFYNDLMQHYHFKGREHLDKEFPTILPLLFHMKSNDMNVYRQLYKEYFGDFDFKDDDTFENTFLRLMSDACFGVGIAQTAELYSRANISTYTYIYSHVGQHGLSVAFGIPPGKHASHGDELFLLFPFFYAKFSELNHQDGNMSNIITSLWTSFAKGENLEIETNGKQVQWQQFDRTKPNFLRLNLTPEMETKKLVDKYEFWTEVLPSIFKQSNIKEEL